MHSAARPPPVLQARGGTKGAANHPDGNGAANAAAPGRMRVYARVRPDKEAARGRAAVVPGKGVNSLRVLASSDKDIANGIEARDYSFDGVFLQDATQADIFSEVGLPVLKECISGVNGAILAYGQTGSGKTYSLLHQSQDREELGVLPRLVCSLFLHIDRDPGNVYEVEAAALMVYNEQIDDLLHPDYRAGAGRDLAVYEGGEVQKLTWSRCMHPDSMLELFVQARANVVYAETKMNKMSSRGHAIFQLHVASRERVTEAVSDTAETRCVQYKRARLSVVDLAGSERVKRSGVEGAQFTEATQINRSLLILGNVMSALAKKQPHIPLRDSKLTRILDGSIGGNCKTAMLVCASPAAENAQETSTALEFACRAMKIEVHAKINHEVMSMDVEDLLDDLRRDPRLATLQKSGMLGQRRANGLHDTIRKSLAVAQSTKKEVAFWQDRAESLQRDQVLADEAAEQLRLEAAALRHATGDAEASASRWRVQAESNSAEIADARSEAAALAERLHEVEEQVAQSVQQATSWQELSAAAKGATEHTRCRAEEEVAAANNRVLEEQARVEAAQMQVLAAAAQSESLEAELARRAEELHSDKAALVAAQVELERLRGASDGRELELRDELTDQKKQLEGEVREAGLRRELAEELAKRKLALEQDLEEVTVKTQALHEEAAAREAALEGEVASALELAEAARGEMAAAVAKVQDEQLASQRAALESLKEQASTAVAQAMVARQAALQEESGAHQSILRSQRDLEVARADAHAMLSAARNFMRAAVVVQASGGEQQGPGPVDSDAIQRAALSQVDQWPLEYVRLLGIDLQGEKALADAMQEALSQGLPEGWKAHLSSERFVYFWNQAQEESTWQHPDHEVLLKIAALYRVHRADTNKLQQAFDSLEAASRAELARWSGPFYTADGECYWHNTGTGVSVWDDPWLEASRRSALQSRVLQRTLASTARAARHPAVASRAAAPLRAPPAAVAHAAPLTPGPHATRLFSDSGRSGSRPQLGGTDGGSSADAGKQRRRRPLLSPQKGSASQSTADEDSSTSTGGTSPVSTTTCLVVGPPTADDSLARFVSSGLESWPSGNRVEKHDLVSPKALQVPEELRSNLSSPSVSVSLSPHLRSGGSRRSEQPDTRLQAAGRRIMVHSSSDPVIGPGMPRSMLPPMRAA